MGNSGILKNAGHGQDIDAHEAVWRLNKGVTTGHEDDVGSRTTIQLLHGGLFGLCDLIPNKNAPINAVRVLFSLAQGEERENEG